MSNRVVKEVTSLSEKDCFIVFDREITAFSFPMHKHREMELGFVEHCDGIRRIVGDSIETPRKYDLVLMGSGLEHMWDWHEAGDKKIREITIQFPPDLLGEEFLEKNQMSSLRQLFERAKRGIAFEHPAIENVYEKITSIASIQPDFYRMLSLLSLLYDLSLQTDYHLLASESFLGVKNQPESRRVRAVEEYIDQNFKHEIRLATLADIAGMTPAAFSRFFRSRTGKTVSDYIIDIRLGFAARLLVDTHTSVAEICYASGFNNISNFNRIFKKKKGCSPTVFRDNYRKNRIII